MVCLLQAILALLLDYDDTLSPIVSHPDQAFMPEETKRVLERLAHRPDVFIAIVSGRSVSDVKSKVGIEGKSKTLFLHKLNERAEDHANGVLCLPNQKLPTQM